MDKKLLSVVGALLATLGIFALVVWRVEATIGKDYQLGATIPNRFWAVGIGMVIVLMVYLFTREEYSWELGVREAAYMFMGVAMYAAFSGLLNIPAFSFPAISQVALRPTIVVPMFFGFVFGPMVGFVTGAVGNLFGDALTGYGLSPQWSIGNGLIGFITGLAFLFKDEKKTTNTVIAVSGVLTLLSAILFFFNQNLPNKTYFDASSNVFGDSQISFFAGISILIGFILILIVRFGFAQYENVVLAITWGMLGNIIGIGFAALSDIFINGYKLPEAIVGEFLPAAGPNLIFTAILLPLLIIIYQLTTSQNQPMVKE
jgi:uncharacterized membrane protein